jgi:hypothetical protein
MAAQYVRASPIPRFVTVRRVPVRYQYLLPLDFMQRCRCVVLGSAPGTLTIAVVDPDNKPLLHTLKLLTGCNIFLVTVDEVRMRILLQRLERTIRCKLHYPRMAHITYLL